MAAKPLAKRDALEHPMQPIGLDTDDRPRFKENAVVVYLLLQARKGLKCDLNDLADVPFSLQDVEQFYQLIGYSTCGYSELSFVSDRSKDTADNIVKASGYKWKGVD